MVDAVDLGEILVEPASGLRLFRVIGDASVGVDFLLRRQAKGQFFPAAGDGDCF